MSLDNASARLERVSSLPATGDARPGWSGRVVAISFLLTLGIVGVLCSYLSVHLIGYSLEYIAAAHHHWIVAVTPGLFGLSTLLCGLRWGVWI
jgi:hypothetical protein